MDFMVYAVIFALSLPLLAILGCIVYWFYTENRKLSRYGRLGREEASSGHGSEERNQTIRPAPDQP